jgi:hypothetical protein
LVETHVFSLLLWLVPLQTLYHAAYRACAMLRPRRIKKVIAHGSRISRSFHSFLREGFLSLQVSEVTSEVCFDDGLLVSQLYVIFQQSCCINHVLIFVSAVKLTQYQDTWDSYLIDVARPHGLEPTSEPLGFAVTASPRHTFFVVISTTTIESNEL